uniref:Peptidase A1 domain-containing protein n=1 Tax=Hanusia phi TaxID=3032 RepID=A0A7S0I0E6_9CRYP
MPSSFQLLRSVALLGALSGTVAQLMVSYHNNNKKFFHPTTSSSFQLVKLGNVNVTFLDKTNLLGYDGQDMAQLGKYRVETRLGMITHCNSANFNDVDGIIGFGWANQNRSAAILKTLTTKSRPHWDIVQREDFVPMPRKFAFTADESIGELQLGGYEPDSVAEPMQMFPMAGYAYGVNVTSIKFGNVELLDFTNNHKAYVGEFDSGTTCLLIPNSTVNGTFKRNPFEVLLNEQNKGGTFPLVYTIGGKTFEIAYEECVEPADTAMILGDPWFRKWIVLHDLVDLKDKKMGLALRNPSYKLGIETDSSATLSERSQYRASKGRSQELAEFNPLSKVRAHRRITTAKSALTMGLYQGQAVDKVALESQSRVTYNIKLSIGTPPQPLQVIFDTGSFMLAVFADPAPEGMKPILDAQVGSYEGSESTWGQISQELSWRIRGLNRTALIGANLIFIALIVGAVFSLMNRRRSQDKYQELHQLEEMGVESDGWTE